MSIGFDLRNGNNRWLAEQSCSHNRKIFIIEAQTEKEAVLIAKGFACPPECPSPTIKKLYINDEIFVIKSGTDIR